MAKNPRKMNPKSLANLKLTKGRPKGTKNKVSKTMQDTLRNAWDVLQSDDSTSLVTKAKDNPVWFYELCKGCFPKDVFINVNADLNLMSTQELDAELARLVESVGCGEDQSD